MLSGSLFAFFSDSFGLNNESTRDLLSLQTKVDVCNSYLLPIPSGLLGRPSAFSAISTLQLTYEFLFYSSFVYIVLIL